MLALCVLTGWRYRGSPRDGGNLRHATKTGKAPVFLYLNQRERVCSVLSPSPGLRCAPRGRDRPASGITGRGVDGWLTRGMQLYELLLAIAQRIAERLQGRQMANLVQNRAGNISGSGEPGDTRDLAAAKAGIGSGKTLEAAQKVVEHGAPELVAAMDEGIQGLETLPGWSISSSS